MITDDGGSVGGGDDDDSTVAVVFATIHNVMHDKYFNPIEPSYVLNCCPCYQWLTAPLLHLWFPYSLVEQMYSAPAVASCPSEVEPQLQVKDKIK